MLRGCGVASFYFVIDDAQKIESLLHDYKIISCHPPKVIFSLYLNDLTARSPLKNT